MKFLTWGGHCTAAATLDEGTLPFLEVWGFPSSKLLFIATYYFDTSCQFSFNLGLWIGEILAVTLVNCVLGIQFSLKFTLALVFYLALLIGLSFGIPGFPESDWGGFWWPLYGWLYHPGVFSFPGVSSCFLKQQVTLLRFILISVSMTASCPLGWVTWESFDGLLWMIYSSRDLSLLRCTIMHLELLYCS